MENKYYTPDISEFYVGFEYEEASTMPWGLEFDKVVYGRDPNQELDLDLMKLNIDVNYVRVKYLDKEDIESLGFKFVKAGDILQNGDYYTKDAYEIGIFSSGADYTILTPFPLENYYHIYSNVQWIGDPSYISTVFSGKIKNKSELKVLLKQLGINE